MNKKKPKDESSKNLGLMPNEYTAAIELFLDSVSNNTSAKAFANFKDQHGSPIQLSTWKSMASLGLFIDLPPENRTEIK